jgi:hypothetical protein
MIEYVTVYGVVKVNRFLEKGDVIKIKLNYGKYTIDVYFYVESIREHEQKLYLELSEYEIAEGVMV